MRFPKYYIGPMSKNVVDCVINHGKQCSVGLISSRRQVDYCGGYVNNWNTKTFSDYVRSSNSSVLLCRDHGGENQGQESDDGLFSFLSDSKHFDLIHIDPFRVSNTMLDAAEKTKTTIQSISNSNLMYEVGTEEAIYRYQPEELKWFLDYLKMGLTEEQFSQIKYAVVQSGTRLDLSTRTNTGNFNRRRLKSFIKVVKKFGLMSKEHNGDYLTDSFDVELRFETGLDAINIAPEFGQIESEYYLEECKKNEELFDELYRMCYNSGKWKKWIKDINRISKGELIMTCCHYILSDELFIKKIKSQFPNSDQLIQKRINSKLKLLNEQTKNYCF
ncbi:MAG: hypothetical protein EBU90_21940 [Proteobacteria bacterium]|nr:hypothetical protein [Pseudomonadota bacterium]